MVSVRQVANILQAQEEGVQEYSMPSLDLGWGRLFGGQVVAQAVRAAQLVCPKAMDVHSIHACFLKAGNAIDPLYYKVQTLSCGRTFARFEVKAFQCEKCVFHSQVSAQKPEEAYISHQIPMPDVPEPASLISFSELKQKLTGKESAPLPIEARVVTPEVFTQAMPVGTSQGFWFRYNNDQSDLSNKDKGSDSLSKALLAYASDLGFLGALFTPHNPSIKGSPHFLTSLDHTLWYYQDYDPAHWVYFESESPLACGGRALVTGRFFQNGQLIAMATQEGLLRRR